MLESRNTYGWGYVGINKGYDWEFIPNEYDEGMGCIGGKVYPDAETAIKAGEKWLKRTKDHRYPRHGKIVAVKNKRRFEY